MSINRTGESLEVNPQFLPRCQSNPLGAGKYFQQVVPRYLDIRTCVEKHVYLPSYAIIKSECEHEA